jgi:DNA-binding response OmpR family regulator
VSPDHDKRLRNAGVNMPNVTRQSICRQTWNPNAAQAGRLYQSRWKTTTTTPRSALLVSDVEDDHEFLGRVFAQQRWTLHRTRALGPALAFLRDNPVPVVVTERDLPLGSWRDLLTAIQYLPDVPLLIVATRLADERLWAEVLNLGGHDVLGKPFQVTELLWVLDNAWRIAEYNETRAKTSQGKARCTDAR